MAGGESITGHLTRFRNGRDPLGLIRALRLIVRQRRTVEAMYGVYCDLAHRPSAPPPAAVAELPPSVLGGRHLHRPARLTRDRLLRLYGGEYDVRGLPQNFRYARTQSIRRAPDGLLIGEYGEGSRIAYVTRRSCTLNGHYADVEGVRHIHSILPYEDDGRFLVTTGDGAKVLDLWARSGGEMRFVRRLRKRLAGYTAAARVNGEYWFGSDFSGRPNYIETLNGGKFFFPPKAYRLFVSDFFAFYDRYLVAVSCELPLVGGRRTVSVFDTARRRFLYCEYLEAPAQAMESDVAC
jgi:hypothetical protein